MKGKWQIVLTLLLLSALLSGCSGALKEPDAEQIKVDLIGKSLIRSEWFGLSVAVWEFAAPSQFQELTIKNKHRRGQTLEYDVSLRLQDLETRRQYSADAIAVYKKVNDKWEFTSIVARSWQEIGRVN